MVNEYNDPGCRRLATLNVAGFLAKSEVNGPGTRAVLWVQGCNRRCDGCFNAAFQPFSPAEIISVTDLAARILAIPGIDGVTFSGGEPFAQAGPLAALAEQIRARGLSVVTYSGYTLVELAAGMDPSWPALLAATDLLIAGPYIAARARPDPLRGSSNQQVIPIGTRLLPSQRPRSFGTTAEFTVARDGTITTSGFPPETVLAALMPRHGRA
ncbi:MAG: radical SAM protein [Methanomicrobiales archaeon]|nr:radical SAM protein [Methanomicrobiales archaeon]